MTRASWNRLITLSTHKNSSESSNWFWYSDSVIDLDDKRSKGTHWVSLFIGRNTAVHFDSFGIEYILQEVLNKIRDKSITHNIFRIQDDDSIMYEFCCTAFIDYMPAGKTLLDYTNLFSPNDYKKNDKII